MNGNFISRIFIKLIVFLCVIVVAFYGVVFFTCEGNVEKGELPSVFGLKYLPMIGDTMNPLLDDGDLVILKKNDYDFTKNRVVAVAMTDAKKSNSLGKFYITVSTTLNGDVLTTTLPDGKNAVDISTEAILGKAAYAIPKLGSAVKFAITDSGRLFLFIIPLALIIVGLVINHLLKVNDNFDEYDIEEIDDSEQNNAELPPARDVVVTKRSYNTAEIDYPKEPQPQRLGGQSRVTAATIPFQITSEMLISRDNFNNQKGNKTSRKVQDNNHPIFVSLDDNKTARPNGEPYVDPEVVRAAKISESKNANFRIDMANKAQKNPFVSQKNARMAEQNAVATKPTRANKEAPISAPSKSSVAPRTRLEDVDILNSSDVASMFDSLFDDIDTGFDADFSDMHQKIDSILDEDKLENGFTSKQTQTHPMNNVNRSSVYNPTTQVRPNSPVRPTQRETDEGILNGLSKTGELNIDDLFK